MRKVCIVQARENSKRLPGKVLLPLNGHTVIGEVLTRCKQIAGLDDVVCAMPQYDNALIAEAAKYCKVICGPEYDVLRRYMLAAQASSAEVIMRITADCPHLSPELCSAMLAAFERSHPDYLSNIDPRTFPKGLDCEIFTVEALVLADMHSNGTDREHVTPWMRKSPNIKRINFCSPWKMDGRLTLDTEDDYRVIKSAFE